MKSTTELQRLSLRPRPSVNTLESIEKRRQIISSLNETRKKRLEQIQREIEEKELSPCLNEEQIYIECHSIDKFQTKSRFRSRQKPVNDIPYRVKVYDKNENVGEMEKMAFDKKFKNYLNHRQQFLEKAKRRQQAIIQKRRRIKQGQKQQDYYNEQQILSNTGSDYQYKDAEDMTDAYQTLATGKRRNKNGVHLFYAQKFQFAFRLIEFESLLTLMKDHQQALISKQLFLEYLFDEPMIMMLYSINPYQVADEISEIQTEVPSMLCFEQFSSYLLADRSPTYFQYTLQNLNEARQIGRGLKCAPIVGKWIDETGIYQDLIDIFSSVDMFGNGKVDRAVLVKKLTLQAEKKRILDIQVIQIVNINKLVPLRRIIYQIEHQIGASEMISRQEFEDLLNNYHRLRTPDKDKLITKLIMAGKYDTSYIYVVNSEVLEFLKQIFNNMQKFAQFFVRKQKYIQKVIKNKRYQKLKFLSVRSQSNRFVEKQTVEDTLIRLYSQADEYIDIEDILDFFSNRGRPKIIQYHVYLANLERVLQILQEEERQRIKKFQETGEEPSSSSDEQFQNQLRKKNIQRKNQKLSKIHKSNNFDYKKKFNVTIPVSFNFDKKKEKKVSIRERKVKQMIEDKNKQIEQSLQPVPIRQVPRYVKEPLYEKMIRDQQRLRKERLEKFRLQIQNSMVPLPQRLTKPHQVPQGQPKEPYSFVAKPMPWYCEVNLMDRIDKVKQQRRQRILEEIINRHHDADLPQKVLKMLERFDKFQQKQQRQRSISTTVQGSECTFHPKISHNIPNFKQIQQRWEFDLCNAKQNRQIIHPEPFSFEERQHKSRSQHVKCLNEKTQNKLHHSRQNYKKDDKNIQIKQTLKFNGIMEKRREQRQAKQKQLEDIEEKMQIRKMRQQKFAPKVRKVLKQNENKLGRSRNEMMQKMKQFQRQEKKKARDYENKMIDIYTKVWNRPLLIENNEYGQNQIKNNSQLNQIGSNKTNLKQPEIRASRDRQRNQRKVNSQYQQKRRRAIEQPPGQYLMEDDHEQEYEGEGNNYDEDFDEQYIENQGLKTR